MSDLAAGHIQVTFDPITSSLPFIRAGRIRALAIASASRSPLLPDLPTVSEAGLPGFESGTWNGLLAPAGTPKDLIDRLYQQSALLLADPKVKELLATQGASPVGNRPDEFAQFIASEIRKWAKVIERGGIKAE